MDVAVQRELKRLGRLVVELRVKAGLASPEEEVEQRVYDEAMRQQREEEAEARVKAAAEELAKAKAKAEQARKEAEWAQIQADRLAMFHPDGPEVENPQPSEEEPVK